LKKLDADIAKERGVIEQLEQQLAAHVNEQAEAEQRRENIAYKARTGDAGAARQLEELESSVVKAEQRALSTRSALSVAGKRLAQLQEDRAHAAKRHHADAYHEKCGTLPAIAEGVEKALQGLVRAKAALEERLGTLDALAKAAEFDRPPHRRVRANIGHALNCRLGVGGWMSKTMRGFYEKPMHEIITHVLAGKPVVEEEKAVEQVEENIKEVV
jgi:chromosome segregation ATPase